MGRLEQEFDRMRFTDEEKLALTARMAAAPQARKNRRPRWGRGLIFGLAAALLVVSVGAACVIPKLYVGQAGGYILANSDRELIDLMSGLSAEERLTVWQNRMKLDPLWVEAAFTSISGDGSVPTAENYAEHSKKVWEPVPEENDSAATFFRAEDARQLEPVYTITGLNLDSLYDNFSPVSEGQHAAIIKRDDKIHYELNSIFKEVNGDGYFVLYVHTDPSFEAQKTRYVVTDEMDRVESHVTSSGVQVLIAQCNNFTYAYTMLSQREIEIRAYSLTWSQMVDIVDNLGLS